MSSTRVAFLWSRLPYYAARCIERAATSSDLDITVISTVPSVALDDGWSFSTASIEQDSLNPSWNEFGGVPDVIFSSGYRIPAFRRLVGDGRRSGAKTVMMTDQNWNGSIRQRTFDPVVLRMFAGRRFDAVFVPGASGSEFARRCGIAPVRVFEGLYGADPAVFAAGGALKDRPKRLTFVGQLIARKGISELLDAFLRWSESPWTLSICGVGPLADSIPRHPKIEHLGFLSPTELAAVLGRSRVLVHPAHDEHWGVVVHEAVLSGCALILGEAVGAAPDLLGSDNGIIVSPNDRSSIVNAFDELAGWSDARWGEAEEASLGASRNFGPEVFAERLRQVVDSLSLKGQP